MFKVFLCSKSGPNRFWIFFLSFVGISTVVLTSRCSADDDRHDWPGNCVDSCVVEFSRNLGRSIGRSEFEKVVSQLGLPRTAVNRSLKDCQSLLKALNVDTTPIRVEITKDPQFPLPAIIYIPEDKVNSVGHVVVLSREPKGQFRVYDPAGNPEVSFWKELGVDRPLNTIVLVPSGTVLRAWLYSTVFWICCCTIAGIFLAIIYLSLTRWRVGLRRNQSSKFATLLILILATWSVSCGHESSELSLVFDESEYNFGVVTGENASGILRHVFSIRNPTSKTIRISASTVSCGCMVAEGHSDDIRIDSGQTYELPITINTTFKVGNFRESIIVKNLDSDVNSQQLFLTGFVQKSPRVSTELVRLRYGERGIASDEVIVNYVHQKSGKSAVIGEFGITDSNNQLAKSPGSGFRVLEPLYSQVISAQDAITEIWRFPVEFHNSQGQNTELSAKFQVQWKYPEALTSVELVAQPLPVIELIRPEIYLAPLFVGDTHVEEIPIRVHDSKLAAGIVLVSSDSRVSAKLKLETSRLILSVRTDTPGDFHSVIQAIYSGNKVARISVHGMSKTKP